MKYFFKLTLCLSILIFSIVVIIRLFNETEKMGEHTFLENHYLLYSDNKDIKVEIIHELETPELEQIDGFKPIQKMAETEKFRNETEEFLNDSIRRDLNISPISSNDICEPESWNNVTTYVLPNHLQYATWRRKCIGCYDVTMNDGEMRLISAFVYPDYIAVVTSLLGRKNYGRPIVCNYYDCNRKKIAKHFESKLLPLATVRCARRAGAEFISLSFHEKDNPLNAIPIIPRIEKPKHEIGVCAGQIYGKGTKWTTLVEFIEHHKLIGASMFYLLIFNTDEPTTRVIHDYQRLGLLDPTWVNLEFQEITWQFHMIQMPDCFHRSRMHSKWTMNIDIDERFMMRNPKSFSTFLRSLPSDVAGLSFPISLISGVKSSVDNMQTTLFETYKKMSRPKYINFKSVYQHEHSHFLFYHWASAVDEGYKVMILNNTVGYFRHYRLTGDKFLPANWMDLHAPYLDNKLNDDFSKILKSRFVSRLRYLFDKRHITCDEIDPRFFRMFENRNRCIFRNGTRINFE